MRTPRPAAHTSPLPALVGAALLAAGGGALAQSADASATTDATVADAPATVVPPEELRPLGGVPMRAGGEAPRHGACACDVPRASGDPRHLAAVAAVLTALAARRRVATASR